MARLAWRQAWRSRGRSLLVISLVAFPIAALGLAAIGIRTGTPTTADAVAEQLGTADLSIDWYGEVGRVTEEDVRAVLPPGTRVVTRGILPPVDPIVEGAELYYVGLTEYGVPVDRPPVLGQYRWVDGRIPSRPGEVALHPGLLDGLNLRIGDEFTPRPGVDLRITGAIEDSASLNHRDIGVVGPGTLASISIDPSGALIKLPPSASPSIIRAGLLSLGDVDVADARSIAAAVEENEAPVTAGAFAGAVLLLLGTGLIAGAAIAVSARRQLRTLGLLGAAGAERAHVRATVLLGGTALGVVGSVVGLTMAIAAAHLLRPQIDWVAGRVVGPIEIPWGVLAGAAALGVAAATVAAYGPARSSARLTVVHALAGRTPAPRRPGRIAARGGIAIVAGGAITFAGTGSEDGLVLTVGLVTMLIGFLVAIPLLVTWSGRLAGALPTFARIALRDVARNGRRSGAALAAGTVALALPVGIATLTLADEARLDRIPTMASDHLVLNGYGRGASGAEAVRRAGARLQDAFPEALVTAIVPTVVSGDSAQQRERIVTFRGPVHVEPAGTSWSQDGIVLIGDTDLLRALHAEEGIPTLERGDVVALGPGIVAGHTVDLFADGQPSPMHDNLPVTEAGDSRYEGFGWGMHVVVSPERATELGLRPSARWSSRMQIVVRMPGPLDETTIERARRIVAREQSVGVNTRWDYVGDGGLGRVLLTLAGMGIALAVVAVVVALLSAESRRDRAILVAVGAGPQARRVVAGASAATVGALSGVLAAFAGFVPTVVHLLAQEDDVVIVVPWAVLAAVVLGVPAIAGAFGGLVSRQPRASALLRPIA